MYIHIYMCVCVLCIYIYAYIHIYTYVHIYIYINRYMYVYLLALLCTYSSLLHHMTWMEPRVAVCCSALQCVATLNNLDRASGLGSRRWIPTNTYLFEPPPNPPPFTWIARYNTSKHNNMITGLWVTNSIPWDRFARALLRGVSERTHTHTHTYPHTHTHTYTHPPTPTHPHT